VAIANHYKIRVCGPNCVGFASFKSHTACFSSPLPQVIPPGRIGYISQSGPMAANVLSAGVSNGIGFVYLVSSGNEDVLEFSDYARFMLQDPDIDIVGAYIEGIKDTQKFLEIADLAGRLEKPLFIMKIGKSEKGRQSAASHTGSLTGDFSLYQATFKQKGIIPVNSIEEMIESFKLFSYRKPVKTGGLAILTTSGGVCSYLADRSEEVGLTIPDFTPNTEACLKELLPSFGTVHNPLDLTGQSRVDLETITKACRVILDDEHVDIFIMGLGLTRSAQSPIMKPVVLKYLQTAREYPQKLMAILSCNTESFSQELTKLVDDYQVPLLQGGGVGLKAIKNLLEYNQFLYQAKKIQEVSILGPVPEIIRKWKRLLSNQKETLTEKVAKDFVEDYGIQIPKGTVVFTLDEAKQAAQQIGYPVVLKIQSSKIFHKTDLGAVKLNLRDESALGQAFSDLEKLAQKLDSHEGFLAEEMIEPGVEMILGITKDSLLGQVIMIGLGGIFTELYKDVTFRLLPIHRHHAQAMIEEIRGSKLLHGFRGKTRGDINALTDAILRMARLAQDNADFFSQMEINPLVVLPEGKGAVALDALFIPKDTN
jgi:acetyltransferase